jgi:hypothetical protein
MAVSPVKSYTAGGSAKEGGLKTMPLPFLKKPAELSASSSTNQAESEDTGDLAEQMNEQNRRKYVKGMWKGYNCLKNIC